MSNNEADLDFNNNCNEAILEINNQFHYDWLKY